MIWCVNGALRIGCDEWCCPIQCRLGKSTPLLTLFTFDRGTGPKHGISIAYINTLGTRLRLRHQVASSAGYQHLERLIDSQLEFSPSLLCPRHYDGGLQNYRTCRHDTHHGSSTTTLFCNKLFKYAYVRTSHSLTLLLGANRLSCLGNTNGRYYIDCFREFPHKNSNARRSFHGTNNARRTGTSRSL
jgi:hypothetical protein